MSCCPRRGSFGLTDTESTDTKNPGRECVIVFDNNGRVNTIEYVIEDGDVGPNSLTPLSMFRLLGHQAGETQHYPLAPPDPLAVRGQNEAVSADLSRFTVKWESVRVQDFVARDLIKGALLETVQCCEGLSRGSRSRDGALLQTGQHLNSLGDKLEIFGKLSVAEVREHQATNAAHDLSRTQVAIHA